MLYKCECGCGKEVEKTIAAGQACRMRIRRNTVIKHNKVEESVIEHNKGNVIVIEDNNDEYATLTVPCWQCARLVQWDDEIEGYKCKTVTRLNTE